mgnify:CR=1 FL=1
MKTPLQELMEYMEQNQYFIGNDLLDKYNELLEKEKANQLIDKVRQDCDIKIEEYRNKLDEFQKVNQNSTLKGQRGEDLMYNMLVEQFPGCQIDTHTSKESHKGDFSLIDDTHHGMIESKNYKKNVPKNCKCFEYYLFSYGSFHEWWSVLWLQVCNFRTV